MRTAARRHTISNTTPLVHTTAMIILEELEEEGAVLNP
jgi:hypothetical protein